jgi:glycosyltransferase involved in cell wall biosynthesis
VGPEGEDPDYVAECKSLVHSLDVGGNVSFTGFMNPVDLFPRIDLLVLASISEGLPLVALEGFAAGVPLVATDVGACRQLVEGVGEADRVLGVAGAIVPINNPQALADACSGLLEDRNTWCRAQQSATSRVEKLYLQEQMFARYRTLYQEALR